jgi:hypothetical protein
VVALQEVAVKQLLSLEPPMGPEAPIFAEPLGPEVVVALELEEQLPELPLTPDWEFTNCVLDELLHVYAIVAGVFAIRNVASASAEIPPINSNLLMFLTPFTTISVTC